jgi:hypothetical protein
MPKLRLKKTHTPTDLSKSLMAAFARILTNPDSVGTGDKAAMDKIHALDVYDDYAEIYMKDGSLYEIRVYQAGEPGEFDPETGEHIG